MPKNDVAIDGCIYPKDFVGAAEVCYDLAAVLVHKKRGGGKRGAERGQRARNRIVYVSEGGAVDEYESAARVQRLN
jgi:hypothetical protein